MLHVLLNLFVLLELSIRVFALELVIGYKLSGSGMAVNSSVFSNFRIDFPHVLGLNICDSGLVWFLELRRLRRLKLREAILNG